MSTPGQINEPSLAHTFSMTLEETGDDCNSSWCLPPETFQSILPKVEGILRLVRKGLEEDPQDVTQEVQKATTSHGSASEDVEREQRKKEREARADEAWKRNQRLTERVGKEISALRTTLTAQRDVLIDPHASSSTLSSRPSAPMTFSSSHTRQGSTSSLLPVKTEALTTTLPAAQIASASAVGRPRAPTAQLWGLNVLESEMEEMERELWRREERARSILREFAASKTPVTDAIAVEQPASGST